MPTTPALSAAKMRRNLGVTTVKLAENSVTTEKIQQLQDSRFLGRTSSGTGNPEQINQFLHMRVPGWTNSGHVTNFALLSAYLDGITRSNKNIGSGNFTLQTISYPNVTGNVPINQGSVLAPNGKIYFAPNYDTILRFLDPVTDTISSYGQITKRAGSPATQGGVLAPNGKIYFIPEGGLTTGFIVDPSNNGTTTFDTNGHLVFPISTNYVLNAVLAPNGKIYVCCETGVGATGKIVVIEPNNNNNCYTLTTGLPAAPYINLGPTGLIYTTISGILYKINPTSDTITSLALTGWPSGGIGGSRLTMAPNGFLYATPNSASTFLGYIDPFNDTFKTYALNPCLGTGDTVQGILAANGKIYHTPYSLTSIAVIDPELNSVTTFAFPSLSPNGAAGFWLASQISPQGNIYMDCFGSQSVLKICFPTNNNFNMNYLTSPFNNKGL